MQTRPCGDSRRVVISFVEYLERGDQCLLGTINSIFGYYKLQLSCKRVLLVILLWFKNLVNYG